MMLRRMYGAFDGAERVSLESVRRTLETESQQRAQGRGEVFRRPAVPFGVSDLPKGATLGLFRRRLLLWLWLQRLII